MVAIKNQHQKIISIGRTCRVCSQASGRFMYCTNACKQWQYRQNKKNGTSPRSAHVTPTTQQLNNDQVTLLLDAQLETNQLLKQLLKNRSVIYDTQNTEHKEQFLNLADTSPDDDSVLIGDKIEELSEQEQHEKDYMSGELGGWNALIQMNLGLDGDTRSLDEKIVAYGLQKPNRTIQESQLAKKHQHLAGKPAHKKTPKKQKGGIIAGSDVVFAPPVLD